jgi:mannosyltransferase
MGNKTTMTQRATKTNLQRYLSDTMTRWLLVGLMLVGFGLRLLRLGDKSVWWDEGWSVWVARQTLVDIARQVGNDVHPPLYFWLLHLWRWGSNDVEFTLRFLSVLLGLVAVAVTYQLGRTVAGRPVGLLAAGVLVFSRFHIVWSQEIRMYALATMLAALGAWAALRVWNQGNWRDYLLYVLSMCAGLFTLYLFFPVPVAANLAWLWMWWREQRSVPGLPERSFGTLFKWGAAQIAILLLFIPWLLYARQGFLDTASATPLNLLDLLKIYWTVLVVGVPLNVDQYAPYTLPVLLTFVAGLVALFQLSRHQEHTGRDLTLLLAGLLIPLVVVFYITMPRASGYAPPFSPRYLVIFTPYFAVLLAWGIVRLGTIRARSRLILPLLMGVVAWAAWAGLRDYHSGRLLLDDYSSLSATLEAYAHEEDGVVLYTDRDWPIFAFHYASFWHGIPHWWQIDRHQANDFLDPIWQAHEGVWLVQTQYAPISDPQQLVVDWLRGRAAAEVAYPYGDKQLYFFARTPDRAARIDRLALDSPPFGLTTAVPGLTGYDQQVRDFQSGDTIHLFLYWNGRSPAQPVEIGVVPAGGDGRLLLTTSTTPAATDSSRQQVNLLVPPDLPSGRYQFYVAAAGAAARFGQLTNRQRRAAMMTAADVSIQNPVERVFDGKIRLLGYDFGSTSYRPGEAVPLTLYWQAVGQIDRRYKVFTHVMGDVYNINSDNFLWGQQDNEPDNNRRPTTTWRSREIIVDAYAIPLDPQAPPGVYQIVIGFYDPVTGDRLRLSDGSDYHILMTIRVEP